MNAKKSDGPWNGHSENDIKQRFTEKHAAMKAENDRAAAGKKPYAGRDFRPGAILGVLFPDMKGTAELTKLAKQINGEAPKGNRQVGNRMSQLTAGRIVVTPRIRSFLEAFSKLRLERQDEIAAMVAAEAKARAREEEDEALAKQVEARFGAEAAEAMRKAYAKAGKSSAGTVPAPRK